MGIDKGRHAATSFDQPVLNGDRRMFLTVLDAAVRSKPGLACGIVFVSGTPTLRVISTSQPRKSVTISCDFQDDDWWYCWSNGETIGPVDDPEGVADVIAATFERQVPPS